MSEDRPLVRNTADPKQVKAAGRKAKYNRDRVLNDLRVVLSTLEGRRFYWRLMSQCGLQTLSYLPGAKPEETAFREGMRNIGLNLFRDLADVNPEIYVTMAKENRGDDGGREADDTDTTTGDTAESGASAED